MAPKLSPEGRRLQTIIVTIPIIAATSCECTSCLGLAQVRCCIAAHRTDWYCRTASSSSSFTVVLYKRLVLGEPQRTLPKPDTVYPAKDNEDRRIIPLKTATGKTGVGAGSTGGGDEETLMKD